MTVLGLLLAVTLSASLAQGDAGPRLRQPFAAQTTSFENESLTAMADPASDSPSDVVVSPPAETSPGHAATEDFSPRRCNRRCGHGCGCGCCLGEPWTLPQPCGLQRLGIRMGGWIEQGFTANAEDPKDRFNGPVGLNTRSADYQMNQLWFWLDRPTDGHRYGWDVGGHVDLVYGTDWPYGLGHNLENHINGMDQFYGMVLPQAYGEVAVSNLKVRGGRFAGLLSYEQVPSVGNFFYSHSYTMCYTEPQLVTGVMADYQIADAVSVQGGFHQGWFMWEDINKYKDFMGGVRWTSRDGQTKLSYHLTNGRQDGLGGWATKNWYAHSIVFQRRISRRTQYVLQHNLGYADDLYLPGQPAADAEWYTINQYLFYQINPRWKAGLRFEWMRDDDGVRVAGPAANPMYPQLRTWDGWGYAGDFYELTAGLNWRPNANWVIRPEVRWDWYHGLRNPVNHSRPFDDGNSDDQLTFAVDAIVTF
ncbi:MAG: porin [Pirellulales bacterium]|nr:porin [Pirellulales bacterium]